jgi:hypothetical protein
MSTTHFCKINENFKRPDLPKGDTSKDWAKSKISSQN